MAYEHLRDSLTKGNLWLYILAALSDAPKTPVELRTLVKERHGFAPAIITFYSVLYKLRREGLVRRSSEAFRSSYEITPKGRSELARGKSFLSQVGAGLGLS
jgi:DNA-binding PadR family transcriptional regulator